MTKVGKIIKKAVGEEKPSVSGSRVHSVVAGEHAQGPQSANNCKQRSESKAGPGNCSHR